MNNIALYGAKPIRASKLYYGRQSIDASDIKAVAAVLQSDWLTQGPKVRELEGFLSNHFQAKYTVTTSSGTSALHLACIAARIGSGDEVITTPLTFAASANCVRYCGGDVVFADIDLDTYNIDPADVERKITAKTKAIIAVDYAGQPAALAELKQLCEKYNIILIEDAAHSIGSVCDGKPVGSIADLTTFSFHPVKTITGGEGGAVLTDNKQFADAMRLAANHGITKCESDFAIPTPGSWYCEQVMLGYNYRLSDIQAALVLSQAQRMDSFIGRRKEIVAKYNAAFCDLPGIITHQDRVGNDSCWHLYVIRIVPEILGCSRREFFDALAAENIQPQVHYVPVHLHPYYRKLGHVPGECPVAEAVCENILSLPLYPALTDEDVNDVISAVKRLHCFFTSRL